jgi:hypothetical protein
LIVFLSFGSLYNIIIRLTVFFYFSKYLSVRKIYNHFRLYNNRTVLRFRQYRFSTKRRIAFQLIYLLFNTRNYRRTSSNFSYTKRLISNCNISTYFSFFSIIDYNNTVKICIFCIRRIYELVSDRKFLRKIIELITYITVFVCPSIPYNSKLTTRVSKRYRILIIYSTVFNLYSISYCISNNSAFNLRFNNVDNSRILWFVILLILIVIILPVWNNGLLFFLFRSNFFRILFGSILLFFLLLLLSLSIAFLYTLLLSPTFNLFRRKIHSLFLKFLRSILSR